MTFGRNYINIKVQLQSHFGFGWVNLVTSHYNERTRQRGGEQEGREISRSGEGRRRMGKEKKRRREK